MKEEGSHDSNVMPSIITWFDVFSCDLVSREWLGSKLKHGIYPDWTVAKRRLQANGGNSTTLQQFDKKSNRSYHKKKLMWDVPFYSTGIPGE